MKKIGLALVALVLLFVIYYVTLGSKQITTQMRKSVNQELVTLKNSGFKVDEQNISKDKQHIVLTFQDSEKIANYISKKGNEPITSSDIEILEGMQVGMDIEYMPSPKYAVSMDIYPLRLPDIFYKDLDENDKKAIEKLDKMFKEKVFLTHINIDKLLSSFDGYMKDVDEVIKGEDGTTLHIVIKNSKFDGTIEDEKLETLNQKIDLISIKIPNQLDINLKDIKYTIKGDKDIYNSVKYSIKSFTLKSMDEETIELNINDIVGDSEDKLNGNLLDSTSRVKVASIDLNQNGNKTVFKNMETETLIKNVNKEALDKLQKMSAQEDNNDSFESLMPILKDILKYDISIEIPKISVEEIIDNGKSLKGFNIKALVKIDKNFDVKSMNSDPLSIVNAIDAKINIEASDELISNILAKNPQAMVMMMVIQPVEKNGKKYYDIEFKKGSLMINGKPFM